MPTVEEQALEQALGGLHRRGVAGAQLAVDLQQRVLAGDERILVQRGDYALVVAEHLLELVAGDAAGDGVAQAAQPGVRLVRVVAAHGLEEEGDGQLAVLVDADVENIVHVRLILQPRAVVGYHRSAVGGYLRLVGLFVVIDAGGADYLRHDDALRAVDDEGAAGGHEREVAHEYLLLLDLLGLAVAQADADLERRGVGGVARLALLNGVLRFVVHGVIDEAELQVAGIVRHRGHVAEDFPQPGLEEPLVRLFLDLQQVGHVLDLHAPGEALSDCFPVADISWHRCTLLVLESLVHPAVLSNIRGPLLHFHENLIEYPCKENWETVPSR